MKKVDFKVAALVGIGGIILYAVLTLLDGVTTLANSAVSPQVARRIYYDLIRKNHLLSPPFSVVRDDDINAHTSESYIHITQGALDNTDKDEMALILGHELSHYQHHDPSYSWASRSAEVRSDYQGASYMSKAGYDRCKGAQLFKLYYKLYGDDDGGIFSTYPTNTTRYNMIHKGCHQ